MPKFTPLPFFGYDWTLEEITPDHVLAPPYDVLSPGERQALADKTAHNVVNIDLPRTYADAAALVKSWIDSGVLVRRENPVFLLQATEYEVDGQKLVRWGIMGGMQLTPYGEGQVYPHEKTYPKAKEDRLALTRAVQGQLSPVFGVFDDPELTLTALGEEMSGVQPEIVAELDECRHSLWVLPEKYNQKFTELLADKNVFIADGHHRYETALAYKQEKNRELGPGPWDYVFTYLSNISSPGLEIFPYHRVLSHNREFDFREAAKKAAPFFEIRDLGTSTAFPDNTPANSFILVLPEANTLFIPKFESRDIFDAIGSQVLNQYFLECALDLTDTDLSSGDFLSYTFSAKLAKEKVYQGESQAAFLLKPVPMQVMRGVCSSGRVMPRKSTFFYPKLPTGLAFHLFR